MRMLAAKNCRRAGDYRLNAFSESLQLGCLLRLEFLHNVREPQLVLIPHFLYFECFQIVRLQLDFVRLCEYNPNAYISTSNGLLLPVGLKECLCNDTIRTS